MEIPVLSVVETTGKTSAEIPRGTPEDIPRKPLREIPEESLGDIARKIRLEIPKVYKGEISGGTFVEEISWQILSFVTKNPGGNSRRYHEKLQWNLVSNF